MLQDIIKEANIKLAKQEKELKKERARGDELERKIQSAELQLDVIEVRMALKFNHRNTHQLSVPKKKLRNK